MYILIYTRIGEKKRFAGKRRQAEELRGRDPYPSSMQRKTPTGFGSVPATLGKEHLSSHLLQPGVNPASRSVLSFFARTVREVLPRCKSRACERVAEGKNPAICKAFWRLAPWVCRRGAQDPAGGRGAARRGECRETPARRSPPAPRVC